ncbi:MAG: hypothetical protein ACLQVG_22555 [Terriglobia bacterium]
MSATLSTNRFGSVSSLDFTNPTVNTLARLDERNRIARDFISDYANRHAAMDVAVGLVGLIPGLSIPALAGAIAAQSPVIYQPMARDLAKIYMAEPRELAGARGDIVHRVAIQTGVLDVAADFGAEFMLQIATELLMEAGWGVLGAMFIPVVGGAVGAALDYLIATQMTWRVGTMVSMYFQNGGNWIGNQRHTFEMAKEMTGSINVGVSDLLNGKFKNHTPRANLSEIRQAVPAVKQNLLTNVRRLVSMLRAAAGDDKVRDILRSQGIPIDLIDMALAHAG